MENVPYKDIIFDLDGTIIDSADEIIDCLQRSYWDAGLGPVRIERSNIGPPLEQMILDLTPGITETQRSQILNTFRKYYDGSSFQKTYIKEGVRQTLDILEAKGINTFIATNKPIKPTLSILDALQLTGFRDVASPDKYGIAMKKNEILSVLLDTWKLERRKTIYVGDSDSDIRAARGNGILSAAVLDGYGDRGMLLECKPDFLLDSFRDILKIVFSA